MEVAAAKQLLPMARGGPPNSPSSSTSSSSPSSAAAASPSPRQAVAPSTPRPVPRIIETTPFPTTFVQADTANFKQVVQRLTGSDTPPATPAAAAGAASQKPAKNSHGHHHHHHYGGSGLGGNGPKKPAFKLYERRIGKNNLKMIAPLAMAAAAAAGASPRTKLGPEVLSPSVLDFPSLALGSPVTPLQADPFNRSPASASASPSPGQEDEAAAERAAIARKGFFLHPSPRAAAEPPRLLPLFPVTSPRMAAPSPAAAAPSPLQ